MRQVSGRELCRILERRGWALDRTRGSHHVYKKHGNLSNVSVPIHGNRPLGVGLLLTLLKQAGIDPNSI